MVAIVTGASAGIGLRTARLLQKQGYAVYGIADEDKSFDWMHYQQADVSKKGQLERALANVYKKEGQVDVLVCSAGYTLASPAYQTETADARRVYDVNFWGCVYAASYVVQRMKQAETKGHIVFVSSMGGVLPMPYLGFYTSSKSALNTWAAALYNEVKPLGIHVTSVLPGGVRTRFSFKRKKYTQYLEDESFPGLGKAIGSIYAIEQGGYRPERIAAAIYSAIQSENPPALLPAGTAMQAGLALERLLPTRALLYGLRLGFVE